MMMSEASRRPPQHFLVLNDKGDKYQLKLEGLALLYSIQFCLKKPDSQFCKLDYPVLPSSIFIYLFTSLKQ
jgi:hypothetical protein